MKITYSPIINWLIFIPLFIWLVCGTVLCITSFNQWYYYTAVALPSAFILTSYFIGKIFKLFGGTLLLVSGLVLTILSLKVFTFIECIIMIGLFTLPIAMSGMLIIIESLRLYNSYSKYQHIASKKLPL